MRLEEHGARKDEESPHTRFLHHGERLLESVRPPRLYESQLQPERPARDLSLLHHVSLGAFPPKCAPLPEDGYAS